jgi:hypothetical protein
MHNALSLPRLVATGVLLAAMPAAAVLPPLVGLAGLVLKFGTGVSTSAIRSVSGGPCLS